MPFIAVDYLFLWAAHVIISLFFPGHRSFRRIAFPCSSILIIVLALVGQDRLFNQMLQMRQLGVSLRFYTLWCLPENHFDKSHLLIAMGCTLYNPLAHSLDCCYNILAQLPKRCISIMVQLCENAIRDEQNRRFCMNREKHCREKATCGCTAPAETQTSR